MHCERRVPLPTHYPPLSFPRICLPPHPSVFRALRPAHPFPRPPTTRHMQAWTSTYEPRADLKERAWRASTNEPSKKAAAALSWGRQYYRLPPLHRPRFGTARLALVFRSQWLIAAPGGILGFCFGQSEWAGVIVSVGRARVDNDQLHNVGHKTTFVHATGPMNGERMRTPLAALSICRWWPQECLGIRL